MDSRTSYERRHAAYKNISIDTWQDWKWQQQSAIRSFKGLVAMYPAFSENRKKGLLDYLKYFKFQLTPYLISQFKCDDGLPTLSDPMTRQFFPDGALVPSGTKDEFHGYHENWEKTDEFPTEILHHKYANKALLDITDTCLAYCTYCFKVARTLGVDKEKNSFNKNEEWINSLAYLKSNPAISEVILSGGDPLVLSNEKLAQVCQALRAIDSIKIIRIHTRCLTHNPYRFDEGFIQLCKANDVTAIMFHVACADEITPEFTEALSLFDRYGYGSILKCAQIPFLHGVNDTLEQLQRLLLMLVKNKIIPLHLFHAMPFTPGVQLFRPRVKKAQQILKKIRRHESSLMIPMYEIVHESGKYEVPVDGVDELDSNDLSYVDPDGHPIFEFTNYLGERAVYLDGCAEK